MTAPMYREVLALGVNADLALAALDHVEHYRSRWDQRVWIADGRACFAGRVALLHAGPDRHLGDGIFHMTPEQAADPLLALFPSERRRDRLRCSEYARAALRISEGAGYALFDSQLDFAALRTRVFALISPEAAS